MQEKRLSSSLTTVYQWLTLVFCGMFFVVAILAPELRITLGSTSRIATGTERFWLSQLISSMMLGAIVYTRSLWHLRMIGNQLAAWRGRERRIIPLERLTMVGESWIPASRPPGWIEYIDDGGRVQRIIFLLAWSVDRRTWMDDLVTHSNALKTQLTQENAKLT
jgi:hypothetical protein